MVKKLQEVGKKLNRTTERISYLENLVKQNDAKLKRIETEISSSETTTKAKKKLDEREKKQLEKGSKQAQEKLKRLRGTATTDDQSACTGGEKQKIEREQEALRTKLDDSLRQINTAGESWNCALGTQIAPKTTGKGRT